MPDVSLLTREADRFTRQKNPGFIAYMANKTGDFYF